MRYKQITLKPISYLSTDTIFRSTTQWPPGSEKTRIQTLSPLAIMLDNQKGYVAVKLQLPQRWYKQSQTHRKIYFSKPVVPQYPLVHGQILLAIYQTWIHITNPCL